MATGVVKLVRDQAQVPGPLGLGRVAAVPVVVAELFELVVQVSHGVSAFR